MILLVGRLRGKEMFVSLELVTICPTFFLFKLETEVFPYKTTRRSIDDDEARNYRDGEWSTAPLRG